MNIVTNIEIKLMSDVYKFNVICSDDLELFLNDNQMREFTANITQTVFLPGPIK